MVGPSESANLAGDVPRFLRESGAVDIDHETACGAEIHYCRSQFFAYVGGVDKMDARRGTACDVSVGMHVKR
jgi:hypothetical protein